MDNLSPDSRVWIYQSNRKLTADESEAIQAHLDDFCRQWTSHSNQLKAAGRVVDGLFLILMADESQAGASGCSIDSSVHFIRSLGQKFNLDLFDRMTFAFQAEDGPSLASRAEFELFYKEGKIKEDTIVFDTLVKTKQDFETAFKKPLKESWHHRFV